MYGGGRRQDAQPRWGKAAAGSLALHLAIVVLLLAAERGFAHHRPAPLRAYAVNIVSPPPSLAGAPPIEAPAPNEGGSHAPAPAAPPSPAPAPPPAPPPAPSPLPAPPAAPKPRPSPPAPPHPPAVSPASRPSASERPAPRPAPHTPSAATQGGSGAPSAGTGTHGAPTGRNPDAASPGGEGLNLAQRGTECPSPGYCENIVRQVRRWFRRPEGSAGSAEACFTILRDGSTSDIDVRRVRGGFAFRMAVAEAVEQAGLHQAFGALPTAFGARELPVCVDISPEL